MQRDYYQLLGVDKSATDVDIKKAYRKLARELHPDVTGDDPKATERFKKVTEAYETLSDPQRRRSYDLFGTRDQPPPGGPGTPFDLDGLLDQVFPNRKKKARPSPGTDLEEELRITFLESYVGCTKPLESVNVTVPAGVTDGTRLRLRGQGNKGEHGGKDGDLYVVITVLDDERFRREGVDVFVDVDVPLRAALLGGHVDVPLPDGSARLTVPKGTQGGRLFRLRGKGFPSKTGTTRGDLLASARIVVPAVPDDAVPDVDGLLKRLGA